MRILLFFTMIFNLYAQQRSDAFIVDILNDKIKVIAPRKHSNASYVLFRNRTLNEIRGKIQIQDGKVIDFFTIKQDEPLSIDITAGKGKKMFFVPMSPPFQEAELIVGAPPYEVPSKEEK